MSETELHRRHRAWRARRMTTEAPHIGLPLRPGDALALEAGIVPDSIRVAAREAVDEFWPELREATKTA
jgi:hypothetical protein